MIELRALGTLVLRNAGGEDIGSVLAQPKRVALLLYLAIARPRGFHRRDTLLALLWPEQDEQHARWALNQALRHLRNSLGKEVLASRGDGEIGITPALVRCDVEEFENALDSREYAQALAMYRGDLLEGFHVSGCSEFERWLDEERVWLKRRAARAASSLAQQHAAGGQAVMAGEWARRAFALSPDDEAEVRQLIELLGRVGDRAGAVQAYEEFARRLATDYQAEPAPETRALIAAVRNRQAPRDSPSVTEPEVAVPEVRSAATGLPAGSLSQRRRRWMLLTTLGTAAVITMAAVVWGFKPSPSIPDASSSSTIAVLPFSYHGAPEVAYLGDGMVELLSAGLNGAGDIRAVDPSVIHSSLQRRDAKTPELDFARQLGARLKAGSFILGEVFEAGGKLRITARVHATAGQSETTATATVDGAATRLFQLLDELTAQLIAGRSGTPATRITRLAALTTDSLRALKAYLEGERYFRDGKSEAGVRAMEQAVRIDSSFALAHYRLATMAMWSDQEALARTSVDRAVRFSQRLSYRDRQLIAALSSTLHGRFRQAERTYSDLLSRNANDLDANYLLGELIFHQRDMLGRSWLDARAPLERVLAIEPMHESSLYHLSNIAAREGRLTELDSLTQRIFRIGAGRKESFYRGQQAIARGDTAGINRYLAALKNTPEEYAQPSGGMVVFTTADLAVGRRIWRSFTEPSRTRGTRVLAYLTLAKMELMQGRWSAATADLDAGQALDPATVLEHRALLSLWPFLNLPRTELLALRDSLLRWRPAPAGPDDTGIIAAHGPAHPYLRKYLLGLFASRLGEEAAALGYARELDAEAATSFAPSFVRTWARSVRAEVAGARGHAGEALAILDSLESRSQEDLRLVGISPFFSQELNQFARAEALFALRDDGDALEAYRAIADELFHTGAQAHFRMAQIYSRRGEREQAARHYERFVGLWKNCDPELRPLLAQAKTAVAQ